MLDMVHNGVLSVEKVADLMATRARLFRMSDRGFIRPGMKADLVLVHPNDPWTVREDNVMSKCGWSPFRAHVQKPRARDLGQRHMRVGRSPHHNLTRQPCWPTPFVQPLSAHSGAPFETAWVLSCCSWDLPDTALNRWARGHPFRPKACLEKMNSSA